MTHQNILATGVAPVGRGRYSVGMETNPTTTTQAHVVATLTKFWTLPMGAASTRQLQAMRTQVLEIMGHAIRRDWATAESIGDDILKAIAAEEDRRTLARTAR